jgi:hypothetical protein
MLLLVPPVFGLASQGSGVFETYSASDWLNWAHTAWEYYQPGVNVNPTTGLHRATASWPCFTDWDIGSYIYAIIFARRLNLISDGTGSGDWQFADRINKILAFLQNRPLSGSRAYMAYDWSTGTACSDTGSALSDTADQGRMLAALHALIVFSPSYSSQVASIYARSQPAYVVLSTQLGTDYYDYLIAEGYAAFGYDETRVFNAIDNYNGPYITLYGQQLPQMKTTAEPLNHVILEAEYAVHPPSPTFLDFARRVSLAQSQRFSSTGLLTAWTEGSYRNPDYVYEWIIVNTGSWQTWILADATASTIYNAQPIAYTKVAFSYLAFYGENSYTLALVNAVKSLTNPTNGFGEGTFEDGKSAITLWGSDTGSFYTDKTNYFVLAAAVYAISRIATTSTTTSTMGSATISTTSSTTSTSSQASTSSSTSTYTSSSSSTTPSSSSVSSSTSISTSEGTLGSTMSTSTSSSISTPITLAPIPGFSWESIIIGIMLGLSVLAMMRRSRKTRPRELCADSKYLNPHDPPLALKT